MRECLNKALGQLNHFEHSNCVLRLRLMGVFSIEKNPKALSSPIGTKFSIL